MFKFLKARHRTDYLSIALKYFVWPEKVYRLAHGHHARNHKEKQIIHELMNIGIVHRSENADHDSADF